MPAVISGVQLEFFSKANITNSQHITLMSIYYAGQCSMSFLSRSLLVTLPTVTGLIDRLVKMNLVRRVYSEKDRRRVFVEVSQKGLNLINDFKAVVRTRWEKLLNCLSDTEIKNYQVIIGKVNDYIRKERA